MYILLKSVPGKNTVFSNEDKSFLLRKKTHAFDEIQNSRQTHVKLNWYPLRNAAPVDIVVHLLGLLKFVSILIFHTSTLYLRFPGKNMTGIKRTPM